MFVDRSVPWYWSLLIGLLGIAAGLLVLKSIRPVRGGDSAGDPRHLSRRARHRHRHLCHHRRLFRVAAIGSFILRRAQSPHRHIAVELAGRGDPRRAVRVRHPALDRWRSVSFGLPASSNPTSCPSAGVDLHGLDSLPAGCPPATVHLSLRHGARLNQSLDASWRQLVSVTAHAILQATGFEAPLAAEPPIILCAFPFAGLSRAGRTRIKATAISNTARQSLNVSLQWFSV